MDPNQHNNNNPSQNPGYQGYNNSQTPPPQQNQQQAPPQSNTPYPTEQTPQPFPDTSYHTTFPDPTQQNPFLSNPNLPQQQPNQTGSSPVLAHPEPHLAVPPVHSPFNDPDSRRSSIIAPSDSYPAVGGPDDVYNADFADNTPLRASNYDQSPYQNNPPQQPQQPQGFLGRLTSMRIGGGRQRYNNINSDTQYNENIPLSDQQHYGDFGYQGGHGPTGYPAGNSQTPYPENLYSFNGGGLSMPDPNFLPTDFQIDEDWEARQAQPVPENAIRQEVELHNGIYSIDYPVPSKVKQAIEPKYNDQETNSTEFSHMRYTACTCDPDQFKEKGYTLRAAELERETELLIAVTYYSV